MVVLLALVLVYTVIGGMISVVITDYIQFVILSVGILVAGWLAIESVDPRFLSAGTIFSRRSAPTRVRRVSTRSQPTAVLVLSMSHGCFSSAS